MTDTAKTHLSDIGYSQEFGARPLKRVIQKEILNNLAVKILEGSFSEGDNINIDYKNDTIIFNK